MKNLTERLLFWGLSLIFFAFLAGCAHHQTPDIDITARSTISGFVNGSAMEGRVSALVNTGRGGSSTCEFSKLPDRFTPGTIGTHA
jgi:hypothetical protein